MIRGYHEYKNIWTNPVIEEQLLCKREIGNAHNTHAVTIRKTIDGEIETVGNVPWRISSICWIFIRRGGSILCTVKGNCQYSSNLPQGGLEIPCTLEFISHDEEDAANAEKLLESALVGRHSKKLCIFDKSMKL